MSSREPKIVVPPTRPVAVREIQLIDRDKEMQILREAVDRAVNGQGGVVFLYGEAGIGKTRLAKELGAYARSRGMQVLSGKCPALFKMDGVPPYVLWEEVIKDYLEVCTPEQLFRVIGSYPIEVSKLVPELKQKLRTFPQSFPLSAEHARNRFFEAVSQFITNISKEAPLLVILDDLQWTDKSSLLLLHYLAQGVYKESLLLLGAYRHTYFDKKHTLSPVLAELNRERLLQSVPLKRMSFDDVSEMIKRILEQDDVAREFCELVYEKTRGNPFFVEEVIQSLKEEDVVYRRGKKWEIKEVSKIEFPETVKDVIKARIGRLDDECQNVLTLASFVGKDFTFEALRGVTGIEEDKLLEIMEKILKTVLIKEKEIRGEAVYSFADIIVRDVVHEEVSLLRRKRLHSVVGHVLEKAYAKKIDEHLGELALHFLESGDKEKALDYFLRAGEKATEVYANSEAASYFQSALKLLEENKGELGEKGRVLERLGDIKNIVGEYDVCIKYWNDALLLWEQLHEENEVARLHRRMASVFCDKMGKSEEAKQHHDKALKILEDKPESVELAWLYADIAERISMTGHEGMNEACSWAEKALELAKKLDAHEVVARSYCSLGEILGRLGDFKKFDEYMETALKISLDNNFVESALFAYNDLGWRHAGWNFETSFNFFMKGLKLAKKVGDLSWVSWIDFALAYAYIGLGDMNNAIVFVEESLAFDRKAGNLAHLPLAIISRGWIYQIAGEWDKSEQFYKEALSISQGQDEYIAISEAYRYLGQLHFDKGEYTKAKEYFDKSIELFAKHEFARAQKSASSYLLSTYIELKEIDKAEKLLEDLYKFAHETNHKWTVLRADYLRAMLLRAQKKWAESIEQCEKILQECEVLNARRWDVYSFARFLCGYARVHLERDQKGDRQKAHNLLNQALKLFQKIGAKKDIEKVESKMTYLETGREMAEPEPLAEVVLPSHITTGYGELDDLLFGGIPTNYAVILTSPSCDERDLLIKSFLESGAKEGQVTFHVVTNVTSAVKSLAEKFESNFYLFVCNPEADAIIKSLPNVFKLKGVENLNDINIALTSAFRKLDKIPKRTRRTCIEIVSDVLLQHHTVQTRRWLNALIPKLKSKFFTTFAVIDTQIHSPQEFHAIVNLFEGEINIYEKETERGLEKFLKIKKMTNQKYLDRELPLKKEERKNEGYAR